MKIKSILGLCIGILMSLSLPATWAAPIQIVAFGGSNTFGKNLPRSEAYPAQLETLLRADGYNVVVRNEGTNGQTTADELAKLDSVASSDVRIVIFQPGGNDRTATNKHPVVTNTKENIEKIIQRLLDRRMLIIFSGNAKKREFVEQFNILTIDELSHLAPDDLQSDGQHLTAKGYGIVAKQLLPLVEELLQKISSDTAK